MTLAYSQPVNVARLEAIETTIGGTAKCQIYSGSAPLVAAAATGTLLATVVLPPDWMATASGAAPSTNKIKLGTWQTAGPGAVAAGTAGYFRITATDGTTTGIQGSIPADMTLDNASIAVGQQVSVSTFTLTAGNQV